MTGNNFSFIPSIGIDWRSKPYSGWSDNFPPNCFLIQLDFMMRPSWLWTCRRWNISQHPYQTLTAPPLPKTVPDPWKPFVFFHLLIGPEPSLRVTGLIVQLLNDRFMICKFEKGWCLGSASLKKCQSGNEGVQIKYVYFEKWRLQKSLW